MTSLYCFAALACLILLSWYTYASSTPASSVHSLHSATIPGSPSTGSSESPVTTSSDDADALLLEELNRLIELQQQKINLINKINRRSEPADTSTSSKSSIHYHGADKTLPTRIVIDNDGSAHPFQKNEEHRAADVDSIDNDVDDDEEEDDDSNNDRDDRSLKQKQNEPTIRDTAASGTRSAFPDVGDGIVSHPLSDPPSRHHRGNKKQNVSSLFSLPIPLILSRVPLFLLAIAILLIYQHYKRRSNRMDYYYNKDDPQLSHHQRHDSHHHLHNRKNKKLTHEQRSWLQQRAMMRAKLYSDMRYRAPTVYDRDDGIESIVYANRQEYRAAHPDIMSSDNDDDDDDDNTTIVTSTTELTEGEGDFYDANATDHSSYHGVLGQPDDDKEDDTSSDNDSDNESDNESDNDRADIHDADATVDSHTSGIVADAEIDDDDDEDWN